MSFNPRPLSREGATCERGNHSPHCLVSIPALSRERALLLKMLCACATIMVSIPALSRERALQGGGGKTQTRVGVSIPALSRERALRAVPSENILAIIVSIPALSRERALPCTRWVSACCARFQSPPSLARGRYVGGAVVARDYGGFNPRPLSREGATQATRFCPGSL